MVSDPSAARIVSVEIVVDVMLFDHYRHVLNINRKFEWPEDRTLSYAAVGECK